MAVQQIIYSFNEIVAGLSPRFLSNEKKKVLAWLSILYDEQPQNWMVVLFGFFFSLFFFRRSERV